MWRSIAFPASVLYTVVLATAPSLASSVRIAPHQNADGVTAESVTLEDISEPAPSPTAPLAPCAPDAVPPSGRPREGTILWHRHYEDPIYTSCGVGDAPWVAFAGTELNEPKQAEATPLFGDGTPDWDYRGNAFFVDRARNSDVLAAVDFHDADSTAIVSEWRAGSSVPLWTYEVHPCRSLVYGGWASRKPIRVSDDGSTIAFAATMRIGSSDMGRLYVFEAGNPLPVVRHDLPSGSISAVEMTTGGEFIALASWPTVYVYDHYAQSMRWSGAIGAGNDALAISGDGRYLAWGWSTFYLREWNGTSYGNLWSTSQGSGYYVGQCGFSPDGTSLAIAWDNGSSFPNEMWIDLYDLPSLDFIWQYDYANSPRSDPAPAVQTDAAGSRQHVETTTRLSFSPDNECFAVSSWGGDFPEIHVFDRSDSRPLLTLDTPGSMYDIGIVTTPHGDAYVVACGKAVHAGTSGRGGDLYAIEIPNTPTGVAEQPASSSPRSSIRISPNPSRRETAVSYSVAQTGPVRLTVHDVSGRLVATLVDTTATVGDHVVVWDGCDTSGIRTASGIYFARLEASGSVESKRIVLVR
jgi:WD40 repeat protein